MKYFLKGDWELEYRSVTKNQFIKAERAAGFQSKLGEGHLATAGFQGHGVQGKIESEAHDYEQDPSRSPSEVQADELHPPYALPPRPWKRNSLMIRDRVGQEVLHLGGQGRSPVHGRGDPYFLTALAGYIVRAVNAQSERDEANWAKKAGLQEDGANVCTGSPSPMITE